MVMLSESKILTNQSIRGAYPDPPEPDPGELILSFDPLLLLFEPSDKDLVCT